MIGKRGTYADEIESEASDPVRRMCRYSLLGLGISLAGSRGISILLYENFGVGVGDLIWS
jgi:hypothetical protein